MDEWFDAVVIGGGFYGLRIALHLREVLQCERVVVLESEDAPMERASLINQARVHNGYHYPRSIVTGYRSRVNLPRFKREYDEAIVADFTHFYAVARTLTKTNARQFELFCRRIGAQVFDAPPEVQKGFDEGRIERVFEVEEPAFDSRVLRSLLLNRIETAGGIQVRTRTRVDRIEGSARDLLVCSGSSVFRAPAVVSAVYSGLNELHAASGFPLVELQQELTEMPLVSLPEALQGAAFTIMDGPFFSMMPFPSRALHSLSHVRYTPHHRWQESEDVPFRSAYAAARLMSRQSRFTNMYADVVRYMPAARGMRHHDSMFEVKTVLSRTAVDDSRPILFRNNAGIEGYTCVLGGKLDNIYDVLAELEQSWPER